MTNNLTHQKNLQVHAYPTIQLIQTYRDYLDQTNLKLTLDWFGQGNPYKFGLIGSSDTHVLGGSFDESNYWSKVGILDGSPEARGTIPLTQERINTTRQGLIDANQPVLLIERELPLY